MSDRSEADCVSNDLVERVARVMWEAVGADPNDFWGDDFRAYECQARAAIAVALEQAAKVLAAGDDGHDWSPDGAAAAIRALVKEPQP